MKSPVRDSKSWLRFSFPEAERNVRPICRLCLTDLDEELIIPCKCPKLLSSCHSSCISSWVEITQNSECDLCGIQFCSELFLKTWYDWFKENEEEVYTVMTALFISFLAIFVLLMALVLLSIATETRSTLSFVITKISTVAWSVALILYILRLALDQRTRFSAWQKTHPNVVVYPHKSSTPKTDVERDPKSSSIASAREIVRRASLRKLCRRIGLTPH